jgi:hypothetical protein
MTFSEFLIESQKSYLPVRGAWRQKYHYFGCNPGDYETATAPGTNWAIKPKCAKTSNQLVPIWDKIAGSARISMLKGNWNVAEGAGHTVGSL